MVQQQNVWQALWQRIEKSAVNCGRNVDEIHLLAVSKCFSAERIRHIHAFGQRRFGENYVQEAQKKREELANLPEIYWVLIGSLQKNKARLAAEVFDAVESVDDLALAERLAAARHPDRSPMEILIQVNISGEAQKNGVAWDQAVPLAHEIARLPRLRWRGFMGIAEETSDVTRQRQQFARLRECLSRARAEGLNAEMLSMGMSGDLEAAICEGSTEVRIGSALFGARHMASYGE
ncbi:MAG: YggS family pyridoxal phosphate-dependent enzyme [Burkholderiales bacterium]|jgi:pyridoxal phosphate enzyme (YggS family)|nr:YggS family pyridoxal phosphate-dependent enzyme [Burkholderiales bacterium]